MKVDKKTFSHARIVVVGSINLYCLWCQLPNRKNSNEVVLEKKFKLRIKIFTMLMKQ